MYYIGSVPYGENDLKHYGVLGMKWGVRRYENPDGTLTPEGLKRYGAEGKYTYKSRATMRSERKLAKAEARGESTDKIAKRREQVAANKEFDARMEQYSRSVKTGGNIISRMFTSVGSKPYTQILSAMGGHDRQSFAKKFVSNFLANSAGGIGGQVFSTVGQIPLQLLIAGGAITNPVAAAVVGGSVALGGFLAGRKAAGAVARKAYTSDRVRKTQRGEGT